MDIGDDIITRRINGAVEEITEGQQDLNEDIINLIKNNFDNMFSLFNNKINEMKDYFKNIKNDISTNHLHKSSSNKNKKGRNSELTINKKYCNHIRSQGRGKCTIMIKKEEDACYVHKKDYKIENINSYSSTNVKLEDETEYKNKRSSKNIEFKYIINKIILINRIKKFLKKETFKDDINNLKNNTFDYNYVLKNKKGQLFKERGIWYTYNLYEQKIEANIIEGIECEYCRYTRYISSPCIFKNCKNRKYGDVEFKIYKKINGKELESKYNKNYNKLVINSDSENSSSSEDEE